MGSIALLFACLACSFLACAHSAPVLRFEKDGTFRIALPTDIHVGVDGEKNSKSVEASWEFRDGGTAWAEGSEAREAA